MKLTLTFDDGGSQAAFRRLSAPGLDARLCKVMAETYTTAIRDYIAAGHSFTSRTGHLEQSINWRPDGDGATVFATAEYAPYLEFGTGTHGPKGQPYEIKPKPGRKALRFPMGGGDVLRKKVIHPGIEASPYFFSDTDHRETLLADASRDYLAELVGGH